MKLRIKLLIPSIFFTVVLLGVLLYIFLDNYASFRIQDGQQTVQRSQNVRQAFLKHIHETQGFIQLVNNNEVFVSGVMVGEQLSVLEIIALFTEQTSLDFVTVYSLDGEIFAQTHDPIDFGKPDELRSWIEELSQTDESRSIVRFFHHKLVLLTGQRIHPLGGPLGVTVVGIYLGESFIQAIADQIGSHVAIRYGRQLVRASTGSNTFEDIGRFKQTSLDLTDMLDMSQPMELTLLEDNSQAVRQFQQHLLIVLTIVGVSGLLTVTVSWLLAHSISQRIRTTLSVLQSAESGELSVRIHEAFQQDEIGELQQGINSMIAQLEEMVDTLERRVSKRTSQLETKTSELGHAKEIAEQAKIRAEIASQAKSEFLSKMSHELRTPLNAIIGFSQVLARRSHLSDEQQDHLRIINRSGEHLLLLINQVLDVSKIEAGHTHIEHNDIDLYQMLDELEQIFQLKAERKQLHLKFKRSSEVPRYIRTDDIKLRQILMNLLQNAIKFTEKGGILLCLTSDVLPEAIDGTAQGEKPMQTSLYFDIQDTGVGIAVEEQERIFDAFTQTSSGRRANEGTGLGLTICRKFIQLLNGQISVESEPGKGATFQFHIPVYISDVEHIVQHSVMAEVIGLAPGQPRYRILVVDDSVESRHLLVTFLEPLDFHLKEAENGEEALMLWKEWSPDVILMDMVMPVQDGYETTRRIKATPRGKETVVIAVTASSFGEDRQRVLAAGCDDFLSKPYRESALFDVLKKHLRLEYIYQTTIISNNAPTNLHRTAMFLRPEDLAILSPELLERLERATRRSRVEDIESIIQEITAHNQEIGEALTNLANRFEYRTMLELFSKAKEVHNG